MEMKWTSPKYAISRTRLSKAQFGQTPQVLSYHNEHREYSLDEICGKVKNELIIQF